MLLCARRPPGPKPARRWRNLLQPPVGLRRAGKVEKSLQRSFHSSNFLSMISRSSVGRPASQFPEVHLHQSLDRSQRVAQLVRDARRHLADGHHLLGAEQLLIMLALSQPLARQPGRQHIGEDLEPRGFVGIKLSGLQAVRPEYSPWAYWPKR